MTLKGSHYLPQGDYIRGKEMLMIDDVAKTLFSRCLIDLSDEEATQETARKCYNIAEGFLNARRMFLMSDYDVDEKAGG